VVGGAFVADLAPDALLRIEARLIGGQVVQMQVRMRSQELIHQRAFMPGGAVGIEVDGLAADADADSAAGPERPWVLPLGRRIRPCRPSHGATQPKTLSRWRCSLRVGTRTRWPRRAQSRLRVEPNPQAGEMSGAF
jgi:hypothetical protein